MHFMMICGMHGYNTHVFGSYLWEVKGWRLTKEKPNPIIWVKGCGFDLTGLAYDYITPKSEGERERGLRMLKQTEDLF